MKERKATNTDVVQVKLKSGWVSPLNDELCLFEEFIYFPLSDLHVQLTALPVQSVHWPGGNLFCMR